MDEKTIARFWNKVDRNGPVQTHVAHLDQCWVWTASRTKKGYGQLHTGGRMGPPILAHRLSWMIHFPNTSIDKLCVCHVCDNRVCVNPAHLFLGTKAENNDDMRRKGRGALPPSPPHGIANRQAKLTHDDVVKIRARGLLGDKHRAIAADYGVAHSTVGRIVLGKTRRIA